MTVSSVAKLAHQVYKPSKSLSETSAGGTIPCTLNHRKTLVWIRATMHRIHTDGQQDTLGKQHSQTVRNCIPCRMLMADQLKNIMKLSPSARTRRYPIAQGYTSGEALYTDRSSHGPHGA